MGRGNGYPHPDPDIEALKQSVSLVAMVEAAGVKLDGHPPHLRGLCPLHAEKTPSFTVSVTSKGQLWDCKGCHQGGDVFDFLRAKEGMSFRQALQYLREMNGAVTREPIASPPPPKPKPAAVSLPEGYNRREFLERVVAIYRQRLQESKAAQRYLAGRHLADPELWNAFQLGFADGTLLKTLGADGSAQAALQALGVLNKEGKEHFYGCIVVPLTHPDDGVVGLYGRRIRPDARYPHMYLPGRRRGVLNWQALRSSSAVVLTESVVDALSVWAAGRRDVTCIYGANGWHDDLEDLLVRYGTTHVTLCLDEDDAGREGVQKLAPMLVAQRFTCSVVALPANDPNEVLCAQGPDALCQALDAAQPWTPETPPVPPSGSNGTPAPVRLAPLDSLRGPQVALTADGFMLDCGDVRYQVTPHPPFTGSRLRVLLEAEREGREHTDNLPDVFSQRVRQQTAQQVAKALGFPRDEAETHLAVLLRETQRWVATRRPDGSSGPHWFSSPPPPPMTAEAREDAMRLLECPNLLDKFVEDTERLGHVGDDKPKKLVFCVAISRRRPEPMSAIILSQSGVGKSTLSFLIQRVTPPEELVALSRSSPKAFYYMPRDAVKQKLVAMDEDIGAEDAQHAVRMLQTSPMVRTAVTFTDPHTGEMSTRVHEVEGPIAYLETTTRPHPNHENATRCLEITLDESETQTRRIHDMQRRRRSEAWQQATAATYEDPEAICLRWQNAQRLLEPILVLNRFDEHLAFPSRRPRTRRDHERFMSLVDTLALLHQHSRERHVLHRPDGPVPYILATVEDYRTAYDLAKGVLDTTLHELSRHGQDLKALLWDWVAKQVEGDVEAACQVIFTRRQVREFTDWEDHKAREVLEELVNLEHLAIAGGGHQGATYRYRLVPDAGYGLNLEGLTTPDELAVRMAQDGRR